MFILIDSKAFKQLLTYKSTTLIFIVNKKEIIDKRMTKEIFV